MDRIVWTEQWIYYWGLLGITGERTNYTTRLQPYCDIHPGRNYSVYVLSSGITEIQQQHETFNTRI